MKRQNLLLIATLMTSAVMAGCEAMHYSDAFASSGTRGANFTGGGAGAMFVDQLDISKATRGVGTPVAAKPARTGATMQGKKYDHAFATQSNGSLVIDLKGGAKAFTATVGVDDAAGGAEDATVRFYVIGDGKLLTESGVMTRAEKTKVLKADLMGVKQLVLRVDDVQDGNASDFANWAEAKIEFDPLKGNPETVAATLAVPELQVWVDELDLKKGTQDWQPPPGVNLSAEYNPVKLKDKTFLHAVGTHANGMLVINLKGAAKSFSATCGVDDDSESVGSVGFSVIGDGKVLTKTGTLTRDGPVKKVTVDLTGVQQLVLQVDSGDDDNIDHDHGDWAEALIIMDPAKAKDRPVTVPVSEAKLPK